MKTNVQIKDVITETTRVQGFSVEIEYSVEEMLALIASYPEIIGQLVELMKRGQQ